MPFLHRLYAELRAPDLSLLPWNAAAKTSFVASQFALQHHHFTTPGVVSDRWIIEIAGAAAGRLYVNRGRTLWRLAEIALCATARGRGVGTALIDWLQRTARDGGACGIDLHVLATNARAAALYSRHGFSVADSEGAGEGRSEGYGNRETHRRMLWRVN